MIELIIAFLLSTGWLAPENTANIKVSDNGNNTFGIVNCDDVGSRATVIYDQTTGIFSIK